MCDETRFGYSTLFYILVTVALLSYLIPFRKIRLICFSLGGFNSSLCSYRLNSVVVLLQELTVFCLRITVFLSRPWVKNDELAI